MSCVRDGVGVAYGLSNDFYPFLDYISTVVDDWQFQIRGASLENFPFKRYIYV